ncbi:uncharacterized protein LOC123263110 [Cotesia glomerata]|uniref:uncharacterized protein LOC123263110 n=1 Tax=Cotesia glomerata TaxID=32391 RepID=UPI001D01CED6|nr:uncharacterized protein LOC123263110 [Cotesia glomerata]
MRVILSVTILVLTFSGSNCLLEEFLMSDDLDPYAAFVSKMEDNLKGNCLTEFLMPSWRRRFAVMNTLKNMTRVLCEYDNVDNTNTEFPWRSIIEKLGFYEIQEMQFKFEPMHLMNKIAKYWTEIDKITKTIDFDTDLDFGCDDLSKYFQWIYNVDEELCNGDINKVYAQYVIAIKDKMEKYASKLNICVMNKTLQNELMAFFKLGMKAHIQRYILTSYEVTVSNHCKDSCVDAELETLKTQFLNDVEAYKNLMFKTMEEFAAYIKKCDAPKPTVPPSPEDPKNPGGGVKISDPSNKKPPAPPAPKPTIPPCREDPKNPGWQVNIPHPCNEKSPAPPAPKPTIPLSPEDPKNPGGGVKIPDPSNKKPPAPPAPKPTIPPCREDPKNPCWQVNFPYPWNEESPAPPAPKPTIPPCREDPKNPGWQVKFLYPWNEESPAPPAPKPTIPPCREDPKNPGGGANILDPSNKKPPAPPAPPSPPPYIELERAYQVTIVSEEKMDKTGSCSHNCDLSKVSINPGEECQDYTQCTFISHGFDVCEAQNSARRYDWVKDRNNTVYGTPSACNGRTKSFFNMNIWLLSLTSCDYCVCTCVSKPRHDPHTLTAVSFREQTSDVVNDKVVVGLRFVKKDYMLHIQIAEARLLPYGKINASTFTWKPLENFELKEQEQKFYIKSSFGRMEALSLGKDWGHASSINLDDVVAPKDYIVTGVRFRYAGDNLACPVFQSGSLELQLQVRKLDFAGGYISEFYSPKWISAGKKYHSELVLCEPDNPLKASMNTELSASGHFVRFQASDFRKDAGQSTVPFFDGFDVLGTPLVPLKGAGVFHRGLKGFGGFVSLKIYGLNSKFYSAANVKKAAPPAKPAAPPAQPAAPPAQPAAPPAQPAAPPAPPSKPATDNLDEFPVLKLMENLLRKPIKIIHDFVKNMD